jgi:DNA-binding sugar fermentation-stimulating protein
VPWQHSAYALLMPDANTEAMQYHLDGIAQMVETGRHAVVVIDRAAGHMSKQ